MDIRKKNNSERVVMQWHSCPGSGGVTVPEVSTSGSLFQSHGDVALRDVGSMVGDGLHLGWAFLEVFSNLSDFMIL